MGATTVFPDHESLRCVLFADDPPGGQLERSVRQPNRGLRGWIQRKQNKLIEDLRPETRLSSHVRGAQVAAGDVLDALIRHGAGISLNIVTRPESMDQMSQWATRSRARTLAASASVSSRLDLLQPSALKHMNPHVWLSLDNDLCTGLRLRSHWDAPQFATATLCHGLSPHYYLHNFFLRMLLSDTRAFDTFICTSRACKVGLQNIMGMLEERFESRFTTPLRFNGAYETIPLCIDTDYFCPRDVAPVRLQLRIPRESIVLLYVGYMSQTKADLHVLLRSFAALTSARPGKNLRLIIGGTGPVKYYDSLLHAVSEMHLTKNVTILRSISDQHKRDLLSVADIFIAPSDAMQESFGLAPIEAMSSGVPQVVADWDGYKDTVVHGVTGFRVPTIWGNCDALLDYSGDLLSWYYDHIVQGNAVALDEVRLSQALGALVDSPELRAAMGEASRKRAVELYSYQSVATQYIALFQELKERAAASPKAPAMVSLDQPAYTRCFGHLASTILCDFHRIQLTAKGRADADDILKLSQSELDNTPPVSAEIFRSILTHMKAKHTTSEVVTVRDLIDSVEGQAVAVDRMRLHIMVLIKQGVLAVDDLTLDDATSNAQISQHHGAPLGVAVVA